MDSNDDNKNIIINVQAVAGEEWNMDAKWGRAVLWCLVGALAAGTGAGLGTSAWLYGRLADAERRLDVNGLKANDVIRPGQELKIPAEAPAKAPPAVRRFVEYAVSYIRDGTFPA